MVGTTGSVPIREVSLIQSVCYREVPLYPVPMHPIRMNQFQHHITSTMEHSVPYHCVVPILMYSLERCPLFRMPFIESFHCVTHVNR